MASSFRVLLFVLLLAGCSRAPDVGSVVGQVTLDGRPLPEVFVVFKFEGQGGWQATAVSDDEGLYELIAGDGRLGAVVGSYKVIVYDARSFAAPTDKESDDEAIPSAAPRIPALYGNLAQMPLSVEVESGEQAIDIPLSSDAR